jgi:hypothetical protein
MIDKWAKEKHWKEDWSETQLKNFVDNYTHRTVIETWVEDSQRGQAKVSPLTITAEVKENLLKTLPVLKQHILSMCGGRLPNEVIPQYEAEVAFPVADTSLYARLDLVVETPDDRFIVYEGKATRKPQMTKDPQVRWQAQILFESSLKLRAEAGAKGCSLLPTDKHYFFFFHTAEVTEVPVFNFGDDGYQEKASDYSKEQWEWLHERNGYLKRMFDGEINPTPSRLDCQICNFRPVCPDRYKPKSKNLPAFAPPEKGGMGLNVL